MVSERRPISDLLRTRIKLSKTPAYVLAGKAGINRTTLSCWMNGISNPANQDAVLELGRILDVPASECFEPASSRRSLDLDRLHFAAAPRRSVSESTGRRPRADEVSATAQEV